MRSKRHPFLTAPSTASYSHTCLYWLLSTLLTSIHLCLKQTSKASYCDILALRAIDSGAAHMTKRRHEDNYRRGVTYLTLQVKRQSGFSGRLNGN